MSIRARFKVTSVTKFGYPGSKVTLNAVCADEVEENQRYHRYTPSGELSIHIDNPSAESQFQPGDEFYLDFTKIEKA